MSNSSLVSVKVPANSSNYTKGRSGRKIELIAIHHMAGVLTAEECGGIFKKANRGASSHYGIGKNGEVGLYVDETDTAWCNSNWDSNCKSVTIETSNNKTGGQWTVSDKVLDTLIKLVADIAKRNNLGTLVKGKNVVWHRMYTATTCPGDYLLSKMDHIIEKANKINNVKPPKKQIAEDGRWGEETTRKAQEVFGTTVDGIVSNQYLSEKRRNEGLFAFEWLENPSSYGSELIRAIQRKVGARVDGYIGEETITKMQKWLGTTQDGFVSDPSDMVRAFQKWLNKQ